MSGAWLVLALGLVAGAPAVAADDGVRVATYNVWGLPWPLAPRRGPRLEQVGAWAEEEGVDVVALQEVWGGSGRHVRRGLAERRHLAHPEARGDAGLAVASHHPLRGLRFEAFRSRRGPDALKRKGVWWVQVELEGGRQLSVGVLHMQAGGAERNAAVREEQLGQVIESIPEGPVVLLGDFNLHLDRPRDQRAHERLVAAGLWEARPEGEQATSRYGAHRLDRVYVRGVWVDGRAWVGAASELSDHRPVVVELAEP